MKYRLDEIIKIVHSQRKLSELCLEPKLNFTLEEIWQVEESLILLQNINECIIVNQSFEREFVYDKNNIPVSSIQGDLNTTVNIKLSELIQTMCKGLKVDKIEDVKLKENNEIESKVVLRW